MSSFLLESTFQAAFEEYLYTRYELKEPKYVQEETLVIAWIN